MYLIDLSKGFSSTGLLAALCSLDRKNIGLLKFAYEAISIGDGKFKNIIQVILNVLDGDKGNSDISLFKDIESDLKNLIAMSGRYGGKIKEIISLETKTSVFDYICCLSLVILFEALKEIYFFQATIPQLGINSSKTTFDFFIDGKSIIDVAGRVVSPLLGAIVCFYLSPFIETIHSIMKGVRDIENPFDKSETIRIFEIDKNINNSYDDDDHDFVTVIETNIDDSTSEVIADALKQLLKKGALDYTITPVTMKKGRQGFLIQVLCDFQNADDIAREILQSTSSFGVRKYSAERVKLRRKIRPYQTRFGQIKIKEGFLGDKLIKVTPEFDDIVRISEEKKISPYTLYNVIIGEINQKIV
jgi:hypothetical protein